MSDKHTEQVLQELYLKRKTQTEVPSQLNDKVLTYARQTKFPVWRWLNGPAISACVILLIVFGIQHNNQTDNSSSVYTVSQGVNGGSQVIYYHDVHLKSSKVTKSQKSANEVQYQQYLTALSRLDDRKSLQGIITVNEDVVVVKVCDLGLVQLSRDVIKQLDTIQTLEIGAPVTLLADNQGRLQKIINLDTNNSDTNIAMCD